MNITGAGEKEFGVITFTEPGKYYYQITEVAGSNPDCQYDSSVYMVTADVTEGPNRKLQVKRTYEKNGQTYSAAEFEFVNTYADEEEPPEKSDKPKTGDNGYGASLIVLLGAGAAFAALAARRRKDDQE